MTCADVSPTLGFMYRVSPEKSLVAFQQLTELLKLESVPEGAPNWVIAEWSYALAAIANNLERADIRDRYLKLGTTFATGAKDWPYESTLNTIGRDLVGINNPRVMDGLFILLRSAEQFQRTTENYQDALAHAAAHFAKAMVNTSEAPAARGTPCCNEAILCKNCPVCFAKALAANAAISPRPSEWAYIG